jgi:hypothetical protein
MSVERIEALLPGGVVAVVNRLTFAMEAIEDAQRRHPDRAEELRAAFPLLEPPRGIRLLDPRLYQSHVRELLERVARGEPTEPLTKAEALAVLSTASLQAKPEPDHRALMHKLFEEVMGFAVSPGPEESYPGAMDEILAKIRRKNNRR